MFRPCGRQIPSGVRTDRPARANMYIQYLRRSEQQASKNIHRKQTEPATKRRDCCAPLSADCRFIHRIR